MGCCKPSNSNILPPLLVFPTNRKVNSTDNITECMFRLKFIKLNFEMVFILQIEFETWFQSKYRCAKCKLKNPNITRTFRYMYFCTLTAPCRVWTFVNVDYVLCLNNYFMCSINFLFTYTLSKFWNSWLKTFLHYNLLYMQNLI